VRRIEESWEKKRRRGEVDERLYAQDESRLLKKLFFDFCLCR
jgi:hypothetical protein